MPGLSTKQVARELAAVAHGKALHAIQPVLRLATSQQREIVYRAMADDFWLLERLVNDLLTHSVISEK